MTIEMAWQSLPLPSAELSLARVLRCGQTFRWRNINSIWTFSLHDKIVLLRQDESNLHYACIGQKAARTPDPSLVLPFINDYFNLEVKLVELYEQWGHVELKYKLKKGSFSLFPGIRMLRQDPWETVISFICSSNNNVKRISKMCDSLCVEFGEYINTFEGVDYFSFPRPQVLAGPEVEARLRELGFGYRARYIQQTAHMFVSDEYPEITLDTLHNLRNDSYQNTHDFLLQLSGVGPKVADCICLMALDKHDVVPVDTHVLQIAVRDYKFKGTKTMTKNLYHAVRQHLQDLFGEYAGWAQLVMFAADLSDLNNGINEQDGKKIQHKVGGASEETTIKIETDAVVTSDTVKVEVKTEAASLSHNTVAKAIKRRRVVKVES